MTQVPHLRETSSLVLVHRINSTGILSPHILEEFSLERVYKSCFSPMCSCSLFLLQGVLRILYSLRKLSSNSIFCIGQTNSPTVADLITVDTITLQQWLLGTLVHAKQKMTKFCFKSFHRQGRLRYLGEPAV